MRKEKKKIKTGTKINGLDLELENYVHFRHKVPSYIITDIIMICTEK